MTPQRGRELLIIYSWIYLSALQKLEGLSWSTHKGKQYMDLDLPSSYINKEKSRELCENRGGFLPRPMNKAENNYLMTLGTHDFFLGINDVNTEGKWVYDDEKPLQWSAWAPGEPNNSFGEEDCVLFSPPGGWNDYYCNKNSDFPIKVICERRVPVCGKRSRMCHDRQQCVHEMAVCDGRRDCPDASDEKDCDHPTCPSGWTPCADGWQCMFLGWKCDGHRNCRDGSDEPGDEVCKQHTCIEGYRKCADQTRCLPEHKFCDGRVDCQDGSDERRLGPEMKLSLRSRGNNLRPALLTLVLVVVCTWLILNA